MKAARIVEVHANADFVIEGYVDPREPLRDESPFGDRGQVRSANSEVRTNRAVNFNSTFCIRHSSFDRPATIVRIPPMEDFYIGGAALTRPAGHPLPSDGRGAGSEGAR